MKIQTPIVLIAFFMNYSLYIFQSSLHNDAMILIGL